MLGAGYHPKDGARRVCAAALTTSLPPLVTISSEGGFCDPVRATLRTPMKCDSCGHVNQDGARFCASCGRDLPQATPNPAYPLIGQTVGGRYHIVSLIGEGGMGVVYKAEQRLGSAVRKVAVKTLHAELSRDPSVTARFHREVGTVAQLEHPNTVRVYDFGTTPDGTLYIAMEYLDGRALNRVIETEGALEPRRAAHLIRQVAGSLDEAHRQGIIHRDLKPENVLLIERAGERDVVKLVDFGIAARTESGDREKEQKLTQQGMVLGTPPYMSPEQFTGKALDARSDVYSLGVMAYEMLTGQLPFQADTPWQWATQHMTSPPRPFEEQPNGARIPEPMRRTVMKALSKDPHDRQSSAGQFYTEFAAALGNMTSAAPAPVPRGKTEAMPEAAQFAMAPTEGMPVAPAMPSPTAASPVALPPSPARDAGNRGGRGLVMGLAGVAVVLALAMGAIALSNGPDTPSAPVAVTPSPAAAPEPVQVAPEVTPLEPTEPEPARAEPAPSPRPSAEKPAAKPKPQATATKPSPSSGSTGSPSATPTPVPPSSSPSTPKPPGPSAGLPQLPPGLPPIAGLPQPNQPASTPPTSSPTPTPPAGAGAPAADACAACLRSVAGRDIQAAAGHYAQCTNPAQKAQCTARAAPVARREAEFRARNQKCGEAEAIINAGKSMGVPAGQFAQAQNVCSK